MAHTAPGCVIKVMRSRTYFYFILRGAVRYKKEVEPYLHADRDDPVGQPASEALPPHCADDTARLSPSPPRTGQAWASRDGAHAGGHAASTKRAHAAVATSSHSGHRGSSAASGATRADGAARGIPSGGPGRASGHSSSGAGPWKSTAASLTTSSAALALNYATGDERDDFDGFYDDNDDVDDGAGAAHDYTDGSRDDAAFDAKPPGTPRQNDVNREECVLQ